MAGPAFTRIHRLFRTMIVCSGNPFIKFLFSVRILSNTKKNSLFHPERFYVPAAGMYVPRCWNIHSTMLERRIFPCKDRKSSGRLHEMSGLSG